MIQVQNAIKNRSYTDIQNIYAFWLRSFIIFCSHWQYFSYDVNYAYISHVMSMDDIPKEAEFHWRAISNPLFYHICHIFIILLEAMGCLLMIIGIIALCKNYQKANHEFANAKQWGQIGLLFTLSFYVILFFVIGSEWFCGWMSPKWNPKAAVMPFIILFGFNYLVLSQKESCTNLQDEI